MQFLTRREIEDWAQWARRAFEGRMAPDSSLPSVRPSLRAAFCFFVGSLLTANGKGELGRRWLLTGTMNEGPGLMTNAFLTAFLERHGGRLEMPAVVFADPRPYVHFTGVPPMRRSRELFRTFCAHSLPFFSRPMRFLDIGCGDGDLTVTLLRRLGENGNWRDLGEVVLVDSSPAMLAMAERKVRDAFPGCPIRTRQERIENVSAQIGDGLDLTVCSLSYHHLPWDAKIAHLRTLSRCTDHLILFELDANNDTPELHSPELALSVYQSYGRIIDFIFAHDTDIATAQNSVDCFLMSEAVSFLIHPRGRRTDYHMLRSQWHDAFRQGLGPAFSCLGETTCYTDEYLDIFALHYGRG